MKKFLAILLFSVLSAAALSGCHKARAREAFSLPESFDETKEYNISFWAKNDSNKTQVAIYEKAIADFEALYPNIHVTFRKYTDYGSIYNDVITNIATNTTPNVCITYPDHIATYKEGASVVVPLDALMEDSRYGLGGSEVKFDSPKVSEIIPKFLEECKLDGAYYALPYLRSTEALYVNKDFVEKLGYTLPETVTWDFVWEVSEAAMKKDDSGKFLVNGQQVMIPFVYKSTDNMMISVLRQLNADYSNVNGDILLFNDTTKDFLFEVAEHARTRSFSTFKISSYPGNYLNAGQCIFAIDSTAGATWMGSDAPLLDIHSEQVVPFEMAILPIPQMDTANPQMISQGPSVCVFNKENPEEVLASWLFTQYLLTNEVQIPYAQTEGYVPVTSKAQQSEAYQDYLSRAGEEHPDHLYYKGKIEATKLLLSNTENTFVTPVFNGSADLRNAAGELIEETVKSERRKMKVTGESIDKFYKEIADRNNLTVSQGTNLGPLPNTSVGLLVALGVAWVAIGIYFFWNLAKTRKKKK